MTDQSIFDNGDGSQNPPASNSNEDPQAVDQLLASIVNAEGKQKYASVEEALKGAVNAQEHISRLETENTQFKQKVEKSTTLQDVLDAMKPSESEGESKPPAELDEGKIAELLEKVVERKDTVASQKANATKVADTFRKLHGEEAEAKYYEAAAAVGMDKVAINTLAASNPTAVFAMLGVDAEKEKPAGSMKSTVNPAEFQQKETEMPLFDPTKPAENSSLKAWKASAKLTNERLGLET
jgi:hypothetical protein